jgi:phospholipid/cholesterol/gamma-HCH transport system ATP-binding protein
VPGGSVASTAGYQTRSPTGLQHFPTVCFESHPALLDISLAVAPGETVVVYGASASGKTVLLKTAIGLLRADEGRVSLLGRDITDCQEEQLFILRRCVGVLFQEGGLFDSMTVEENVAYPLVNREESRPPEAEIQRRVQEALDFVELGTAGPQYPGDLSGGMRRRVGIARATIAEPALILYDSPTAGLDPISAYRITTLVVRQWDRSSATSVVVTHRYQDGYMLAKFRHDPETGRLRLAASNPPPTRFVVLREGRKVFEGSQQNMRDSPDPYVARFAGKRIPAMNSAPPHPAMDVAGRFVEGPARSR